MAKTKRVKDIQEIPDKQGNMDGTSDTTSVVQPYQRNHIIVKRYKPIPRFKSGCKNC